MLPLCNWGQGDRATQEPGKEQTRNGYSCSPVLCCLNITHILFHLTLETVRLSGSPPGLRKASEDLAYIWDSVKQHRDVHGVEERVVRMKSKASKGKNYRIGSSAPFLYSETILLDPGDAVPQGWGRGVQQDSAR